MSSEELSDAIRTLVSDLHICLDRQAEENPKEVNTKELDNEEQLRRKEAEDHEKASSLAVLQPNLTRVFNSLSKFAEASLKVYEDIKQGSEAARNAYANGRIRFLM